MRAAPSRSAIERFDAKVQRAGVNPYIGIPREVSARLNHFASAGRIRVAGKLNGVPVQGTLVPVKNGRHRFYVNGGMRAAARIDVGDAVGVELRAIPPTAVVPPADLTVALRAIRGAAAAFRISPSSRRRELLRYIDDARTPDARRRRIEKTIDHLLGRAEPVAGGEDRSSRPMWTCPKCGNRFVTRNMFHSCARGNLDAVFEGKPREIRQLFERFRTLVEACGSVSPVVYRDRVGYMARVRFAGAVPRQRWLEIGFWLRRRLESPRIDRIETIYPNAHVHRMRVTAVEQLDAEVAGWLRESFEIGCQRA